MDLQELSQQGKETFKKYTLPIVVGVLGLSILGYGVIYSLVSWQPQSDIVFESQAKASESATITTITIDVAGAVTTPKVYSLRADSRIQDALIAAGGLAEDADRVWIAKNLNLAAKLSDGMKLYIPTKLDTTSQTNPGASAYGVLGSSATTSTTILININTATASQLDTLSGVGAVTAEKIIQNRPYATTDELVKKNVLGQKTFEKIKDKIVAQ